MDTIHAILINAHFTFPVLYCEHLSIQDCCSSLPPINVKYQQFHHSEEEGFCTYRSIPITLCMQCTPRTNIWIHLLLVVLYEPFPVCSISSSRGLGHPVPCTYERYGLGKLSNHKKSEPFNSWCVV